MLKTTLLNIRIDPELKEKARKLAEAEGRPLSNWVMKFVSSRVREAEKAENAAAAETPQRDPELN